MTIVQGLTLLAAILGLIGTVILFRASYAIQPLEGSPFNSPALQVWNEKIKAENKSRIREQKCGLALLCCSFAVQAVTVFVP